MTRAIKRTVTPQPKEGSEAPAKRTRRAAVIKTEGPAPARAGRPPNKKEGVPLTTQKGGTSRAGQAKNKRDTADEITVKTLADFRSWLEQHHAGPRDAVWVVTFKKSAGPATYVAYQDMVRAALCYGWIDSTVQRVDDRRSRQYWVRRRPNSVWSAVNKGYVEELTKAGMMKEAGLEAVSVAKRNGRWTAADQAESGDVPSDLADALTRGGRKGSEGQAMKKKGKRSVIEQEGNGSRQSPAQAGWEKWPPSSRKQAVFWVTGAKGCETRARRVGSVVAQAEAGLPFQASMRDVTDRMSSSQPNPK